MRYPTLCLFLFSSILSYGQVESVELFPELINDPAFSTLSPSLNNTGTRLCFRRKSITTNAIMISDKAPDGKWSEPYTALLLGGLDVFQVCSLSADGKHIYFDMNNDLYRLDYAEEKKWSEPQRLMPPVSQPETMEGWPSISRDSQSLSFLRNIKTGGSWQLTPFISVSDANGEWTTPKEIKIKELKENEELHVFYYTNENKLCFFTSGSSRENWGNYCGFPDSSGGLTRVKKIDFDGGYIMWVNQNYTAGLIITPTQPVKIATIKFSQSLVNQLTKNK